MIFEERIAGRRFYSKICLHCGEKITAFTKRQLYRAIREHKCGEVDSDGE